MLSAVHYADEVRKKISTEIEMGMISEHIPISNMRVSPIGVVLLPTYHIPNVTV